MYEQYRNFIRLKFLEKKLQKQKQREMAFQDAVKEADKAMKQHSYHTAYVNYVKAQRIRPKDRYVHQQKKLAAMQLNAFYLFKKAENLKKQQKLRRKYGFQW